VTLPHSQLHVYPCPLTSLPLALQIVGVSYYYRIYIAAVTAMAEQQTELNILDIAKKFVGPRPNTRRSLLNSHNGEIKNGEVIQAFEPDFYEWVEKEIRLTDAIAKDQVPREYYFDSFLNATCGCWDVEVEVGNTTTTFGSAREEEDVPILLQPFALGFNSISDKEDLQSRGICPAAPGDMVLYEAVDAPWELQDDGTYAPARVRLNASVCVAVF